MGKTCTLSSEIVHKNKWYRIRHDEIIRPDGTVGPYYVLERESFCLVMSEHDGRFLLVEEDRYPTGTRVLDFPGGGFEPNEDPRTAALREFEEETGYRATAIRLLSAPYAYVGISNVRSYIYLTSGPYEHVGQNLDSSEEGLKVLWLTREEIRARLKGRPEASGDVLKCLAAYDMFR